MEQNHKRPVIRAIDIGYGNTKWTQSRGPANEIQCNMFPSIAAVALNKEAKANATGRNSIVVEVNGKYFEVGKESFLAVGSKHVRDLDRGFSKSATYMALLKGALYYMQQPHIDLLTLGLPVSAFNHPDTRNALIKLVQGDHKLCDGITVHIENVHVIPQPVGGALDFAVRENKKELIKDSVNAIFDPGYFTFDWWTAFALKTPTNLCGSTDGGVSAYLKTIAESINREFNAEITEYHYLDEALRKRKPFVFQGREINLEKYKPSANQVIDKTIKELKKNMGSADDVHNMILVGGGAELFKPALQAAFPTHQIHTSQENVFSNVRGFQLAGEQAFRQNNI